MTVDFQQIRAEIAEMSAKAHLRQERLRQLKEDANAILSLHAENLDLLRDKVASGASFNPNLRSAIPGNEPLDGGFPLPALPQNASLVAADGSQINPDRHAAVDYFLINVGAIKMALTNPGAPVTTIKSRLHYDDEMFLPTGRVTEGYVALLRDLEERKRIAEIAGDIIAGGQPTPIITMTDGPLELWVGREGGAEAAYQDKFSEYLEILRQLKRLNATTAGYVDRPSSDLVVRLLEIASLDITQLPEAGKIHPLLGLTDADLYRDLLAPGERSAAFGIQSRLSKSYDPDIAIWFFYLNVGKRNKPYLARVEIPGWVANRPTALDALHAILVQQCTILGERQYPYLLHRAHEVAVVTRDEKEQIDIMLLVEMRRRGHLVEDVSNKQAVKNISGGKRRYGK